MVGIGDIGQRSHCYAIFCLFGGELDTRAHRYRPYEDTAIADRFRNSQLPAILRRGKSPLDCLVSYIPRSFTPRPLVALRGRQVSKQSKWTSLFPPHFPKKTHGANAFSPHHQAVPGLWGPQGGEGLLRFVFGKSPKMTLPPKQKRVPSFSFLRCRLGRS